MRDKLLTRSDGRLALPEGFGRERRERRGARRR
jgi:hypothetical protein